MRQVFWGYTRRPLTTLTLHTALLVVGISFSIALALRGQGLLFAGAAAFSGALMIGYIFRIAIPQFILRFANHVSEMEPESKLFVSWAMSERAMLLLTQSEARRRGWSIITFDDHGLKVWRKSTTEPETSFTWTESTGIKVESDRISDLAIRILGDGESLLLFPTEFRLVELSQARPSAVRRLATALAAISRPDQGVRPELLGDSDG